jgi:hypothetical protein
LDITRLPENGFEAASDLSVSANKSLTSTNDPDLEAFRETGGKLLPWHGLVDQEITFKAHRATITALKAKMQTCETSTGSLRLPGLLTVEVAMDCPVLVDWVERSVAPDYLPSAVADGKQRRNICPYTLVLSYTGGDHTKESFECDTSYT